MTNRATREQRRWDHAAPAPENPQSWGCAVSGLALAGLLLWLYSVTSWVWVLVPLALICILFAYAIGNEVYEVALLMSAQRKWRGIRGLVIHSDSPVWDEHIRTQWLPHLGSATRQLNWSQRATWSSSLEVRLFRQFCLATLNYNPAVLVFRGLRAPLVFRFFYAFREARHGNRQYLERLETQMFTALGVSRGGPTRS
jgi:hypothetical protein